MFTGRISGRRTDGFDPKLLRKLAALYRQRAASEPTRATTFLEIASDMEAEAQRQESKSTP